MWILPQNPKGNGSVLNVQQTARRSNLYLNFDTCDHLLSKTTRNFINADYNQSMKCTDYGFQVIKIVIEAGDSLLDTTTQYLTLTMSIEVFV